MPFTTDAQSTSAPAITYRQAQEALQELLRAEHAKAAYWKQRDTHECALEEHPFGLETKMVLPHLPSSALDNAPRLIAWPGATDSSVEAMRLMLQQHAKLHGGDERVRFRLRIVRVQHAEDRNHPDRCNHNLYFELITGVGTFICGGCNDYSGAGGYGGRQLESIFNFLAALYEIRVEEVVIPLAEGEAGEKKFKDAYNAFSERRSSRAA